MLNACGAACAFCEAVGAVRRRGAVNAPGEDAAVSRDSLPLAGPATVLCRSFDHLLCSKGDEPWAQAGRMNFAKKRRG
jgi:hypothetical protein